MPAYIIQTINLFVRPLPTPKEYCKSILLFDKDSVYVC